MSAHTASGKPCGDGYRVTEDGRVYSIAANWRGYGVREMRHSLNDDGYPSVRILRGGKRTRLAVHVLVAAAHLPPRPSPNHEIRHLDGNKLNPNAANLCWGTQADNAADREQHGRTSRGYAHSQAIKAGLAKARKLRPSGKRARLIASAPALLAALEMIMGWIDNWNPNFEHDDEWPAARDAARAAIAAAKGEA